MRYRVAGLLIPLLLIPYSLFLATPAYAQAPWGGACVVGDVATLKGLECLFSNILAAALQLIGLAGFVMVIVGGLKILTSAGDPKATESGKSTATAGALGVAAAIGFWFALLFLENFTGVTLTTFTIPTF